jgi:hypothetical protein
MKRQIEIGMKKFFMIVLIIIVSILVILAFYSNRYKFNGISTIRYMKVSINEEINISQLADRYSNSYEKDIFLSELKRVNNLSTDSIYGGTVFIPVFKSN